MNNFYSYNPTKILFGQGMIERLRFELPQGARVMMVYGTGSIKNNGCYEQVVSALSDVDFVEYGGITPNPQYQDCLNAAQFALHNRVDFLLAVGGGSVIDATKFIAMAMCNEQETPWHFLTGATPAPSKSIPFGCVLTAPATGSESNCGCIISDDKTQQKLTSGAWHTYPQFSVIEPSFAATLPQTQIANGLIDTFIHVLEQYVTTTGNAMLQDRQSEAILLTVKELAPLLLDKPDEQSHWNNLAWCASQAMSGALSRGVSVDWSTHEIAHHLTALYGIAHARTLTLVLPALWRHQMANKEGKLAQYGRRVWGIEGSDLQVAQEAIKATQAFFSQLGMPLKLSDYQLDSQEVAQQVSARFSQLNKVVGEHKTVDALAVKEILSAC